MTRFIDNTGAPIAGGITHAIGPVPILNVARRVPSSLVMILASAGTSMPLSESEGESMDQPRSTRTSTAGSSR